MTIYNYIQLKGQLQQYILDYTDGFYDLGEVQFKKIIKLFDKLKISQNICELKTFLCFIVEISRNNHHTPDFFNKIEAILLQIKPVIIQELAVNDIISIFKPIDRLLLFLIQSEIVSIEQIPNYDTNYFYLECRDPSIPDSPEDINFRESRRLGSNHHELSKIIQNDSIKEFVKYVNESNLNPKETIIKNSIFETNDFLKSQMSNMIDYAIFSGSLKIIRYLNYKRFKMSAKHWIYAIHGGDINTIHYLEEKDVQPSDPTFYECIKEAILCFNNNVANYLINKCIGTDSVINKYSLSIIKSFNFSFYPSSYVEIMNSVELVIPEDLVTEIEDSAFQDCLNLKTLKIPDSVKTIGKSSFKNCLNLKKIKISSSVKKIDDFTFFGCPVLSKIEMPETVELFGNYSFSKCRSITSLTVPFSVKSIGNSCFEGCSHLSIINLPSSIVSIGDSAFSMCIKLRKIIIPDSVVSIGNSAFFGCSSLSEVCLSSSIHELKYFLFAKCNGLKKIVIPSGVTSIWDSCFKDCKHVNEIVIPDSVTFIGNSAFNGCSSLSKITVPDSVVSVGKGSFEGCASLGEIQIPHKVKVIRNKTFKNCQNLSKVSIPDSVTAINELAFYGCVALHEISIPSSVRSIELNAIPLSIKKI